MELNRYIQTKIRNFLIGYHAEKSAPIKIGTKNIRIWWLDSDWNYVDKKVKLLYTLSIPETEYMDILAINLYYGDYLKHSTIRKRNKKINQLLR